MNYLSWKERERRKIEREMEQKKSSVESIVERTVEESRKTDKVNKL